jgi:hypothetical protein
MTMICVHDYLRQHHGTFPSISVEGTFHSGRSIAQWATRGTHWQAASIIVNSYRASHESRFTDSRVYAWGLCGTADFVGRAYERRQGGYRENKS